MDGYAINKIRQALIDDYKILTQRYFTIIAPRSVFLTTEQLETLEQNPYIGGMNMFSAPVEIRVTIEKIINAYYLGGDNFSMTYKHARKDIPVIYETLQRTIKHWTQLKTMIDLDCTAPLSELSAMEAVTRSIFGIYRIYYLENLKKIRSDYTDENMLYLQLLNNRNRKVEEISFVSYIDLYHEQMALLDKPANTTPTFAQQENAFANMDLDKEYPTIEQLRIETSYDVDMWDVG